MIFFAFRFPAIGSLLTLFFAFNSLAQSLPDKLGPHPRLLFLEEEVESINQNIQGDEIWAKSHNSIIQEADEIIDLPLLERIQSGRRLLKVSRECLRRTLFLAYAYRMTKNEKYADRVEEELVNVANFSDWNPSHFLDVAEMTLALAIGYDWCYGALSVPTQLKVQAAIIEKGLYPSFNDNHNAFLNASHNWNQVCNAGMTYGALVLYNEHKELAQKIIERSAKSIVKPMIQYAPDGGYPEGYGYWGYGTTFNVLFIDAVVKALGTDFGLNSQPGFMETGAYIQHMIGPSMKSFNFSDCGTSVNINPASFWFASKTQEFGNIYYDKLLMQNSFEEDLNNRVLPLLMVWGAKVDFSNEQKPASNFWYSGGESPVATFRTSWEKDAIYVGLKAGSPFVNHAHMDLGSFVMDAMGERWSMDFGAQNYNSLESKGIKIWDRTQNSQRWEVLRYNNLSHSTLSFDNKFQNVHAHADITKQSKLTEFLAAQTDISEAYEGQVVKAVRSIAIENENMVIVKDEIINNNKASTMQWRMLTPGQVKAQGKDFFVLEQKGKTLTLKVMNANGIELKTWSTQPTTDYDEENPDTLLVGFEVALKPNEQREFQVILVPEDVKVPQKVSKRKWFD